MTRLLGRLALVGAVYVINVLSSECVSSPNINIRTIERSLTKHLWDGAFEPSPFHPADLHGCTYAGVLFIRAHCFFRGTTVNEGSGASLDRCQPVKANGA